MNEQYVIIIATTIILIYVIYSGLFNTYKCKKNIDNYINYNQIVEKFEVIDYNKIKINNNVLSTYACMKNNDCQNVDAYMNLIKPLAEKIYVNNYMFYLTENNQITEKILEDLEKFKIKNSLQKIKGPIYALLFLPKYKNKTEEFLYEKDNNDLDVGKKGIFTVFTLLYPNYHNTSMVSVSEYGNKQGKMHFDKFFDSKIVQDDKLCLKKCNKNNVSFIYQINEKNKLFKNIF
jgi:hypothetical protein